LPRRPHEEWGLLHEESPKNYFLFSFERIMKMFNHTATFKRESDLPLITQYLTSIEDIEDVKFFKSVEHKNKTIKEFNYAPVAYIQSDCYTPSNRDLYVKTLMEHIKVDSYGTCIHNKDLPQE
jgi:alpha-1,3-fucosyltransferase 10